MTEPQPYRSDVAKPLTDEDDAFGHADYVTSLLAAVAKVDSPATLGLLGAWGTGKSRILGTLVQRVNAEQENAAAVVFDVWKYEGDDLRREFIRDLGGRLRAEDQLKSSFDLDEHLERLDVDQVDFRPKIRVTPKAAVKALWHALLTIAALFLVLLLLPTLGDVADPTRDKLLVSIAGGLAVFIVSGFAQVVRLEQIQITRTRLQSADEFAHSFETMLNDGLKANRLIVGIDNLDRCSPDRVTELLTTIKTFLEPVTTEKELVFVLAADDAALRRHLISQELTASGGQEVQGPVSAPDPGTERTRHESAERVPDDVQEAVEEYLRKFFTGVLRVSDFLDTDIRDFTREELRDFVSAHACSGDAESQLVELVATALKKNPRRIKQFINGLELRLELLAARKEAGRIQIDPNVLVVAKLAVIEEQFSDKYEPIKRDPSRLQEWHDEVRRGRDPAEEDEDDPDYSEHDWHTFLRLTEEIRADDLQPYLRLQQDEVELRLPRYRDFASFLDDGKADALDALLSDSDVAGQADEYRAEVVPLLRDRTRRTFYSAALNIVRTAIESEHLAPVADQVLKAALPDWHLRRRLGGISFAPLLERASRLDDSDFNEVVGVLIEKLGDTSDGGSETRKALSQALTEYLDRINDRCRQQITGALTADGVRTDFGSYVGLAESDPALVPRNATEAALAHLQEALPWDAHEPAFRVAAATLAARNEDGDLKPSEASALGDALTNSLFEQMADEEGYRQLASAGSRVLRQFDVPQTQLDASVGRFESEWPQIPNTLRPAAIDVISALLDAGTDETREAKAESFVNNFFNEEPNPAVAWAREREFDFGRSFQQPVELNVARIASGDIEDDNLVDAATQLIRGRPRADRERLLGEAIGFAVRRGRYQRAATMLNEHRDHLGEQYAAQVDRILELAFDGSASDATEILPAVAELDFSSLTDEQVDRQTTVVRDAAVSETPSWREAYERLTERGSPEVTDVLGHLLDHVVSQGPTIENHAAQIELLSEEQERLTAAQRRQLGRVLNEGIERVAQAPPTARHVTFLAPALGRLTEANVEDRRDWVSDLITREQQQPDLSLREALLRAADSLAGPHGSARDEVKARLKKLKKGDGNDVSLFERLSEDG